LVRSVGAYLPLPAGRQPRSNQPCLFVQLKLFVPCFPWHARLPPARMECHTFSFPPLFRRLCFLEAKTDKPADVCVCVYVCVGVVKSVSMTGVVLASSLVLNSSPLLPTTNTYTLNKTSVLHTSGRLWCPDATHSSAIDHWYRRGFQLQSPPRGGRRVVKTHLLRAASFHTGAVGAIRAAASQRRLPT